MASPDQTPPEENARQDGDEMAAPQAAPLFEFPPDTMQNDADAASVPVAQPPQPAPITQVLPEEDAASIASTSQEPVNEEAVRKGLVYPPPPSFYQNMRDAPEHPVLPPKAMPLQQPLPPVNGQYPFGQQGPVPLQAFQQGQQGQQIPPGYSPYPPYPPPFMPPYPQKPPVKKSRRWLWITLSIVGVVLLASCGLCGWAAYNLFSPAYQGVSNSLSLVDDYYSALQAKNYAAAYDDLSTQYQLSGLTEAKFAQEASARDTQYGAIQTYSPGQTTYSTGPNNGFNFTHFTYAVSIKRPNLSYTATLTLSEIQNQWKITNFDSV